MHTVTRIVRSCHFAWQSSFGDRVSPPPVWRYKTLLLAALISLTCTLLSAASAPPVPEPQPARTGSYEDDLKDSETGGFLVHYAVCAPTQLPKERYLGLIMAFHGNGHEAAPTAAEWLRALNRNNLADRYVVVAPKAQGSALKNTDDAAVTKLIDWALATYPIDPRQVYANGFSAGAWYAGDYGSRNQERFAAISMYAGGMRGGTAPQKNRDQAPPFYLVAGVDDGMAKTQVYGAREKLAQLGFRFVFREVDGLGHAVGNNMVVDDNLRWMAQQRSNLQPLMPDQEALLRSAAKPPDGPLMWTKPNIAKQLVHIGGMYTAAAIAKFANHKNDNVRLAIANASSDGWFGPEQLSLLTRMLKDKSVKVRQAAIRAIANPTNWNWMEAKQIMVAIASTDTFDIEDRLLALHCLAYATTFISLSDRWDDTVIMPGLAELLNDPLLKIRVEAATILFPLKKDGDFDYHPALKTASERAKSVALWKAWVAERCSAWKHAPAQ